MFRIVTPMFNAGALVAENVAMLRRQTHRDFQCVLVDDCSTDDSVAIARRAIAGDSRFELLCNEVKRYAIGNAVTAPPTAGASRIRRRSCARTAFAACAGTRRI